MEHPFEIRTPRFKKQDLTMPGNHRCVGATSVDQMPKLGR
jgi:hypothetical protein